ncbi:hypothetical protein ACS0TY_034173 [Phlomoides rotata]
MEIAQFQQREDENINDAWERFNSLLRKCPQHGNGDEQIVTFFYNGLCPTARQYVDASAGGSIFNLGGVRARDMIDTIAANSCHWPTDHGRRYRVAQVEEGGTNEVLAEAMKLLMDKVDKLSTKVDMNSSQGMEHCEEANYLGRPPYQQGNFQDNNQFQNTNPHQGIDPGDRAPNNEGKPSIEDTLAALVAQTTQINTRMGQRIDKVEEQMSIFSNQMKNMEFQIGQLASSSQSREKGSFHLPPKLIHMSIARQLP